VSGQLPIVVGVTGASGAIYARRLLQVLLASAVPVDLIVSDAARIVIREEENADIGEPLPRDWLRSWLEIEDVAGLHAHSNADLAAPPSSGSYRTRGMVVVPCSGSALGAIAHGLSRDLIQRAADVTLKEARPLVLVPRETPLNRVHLANLLTAHDAGARILPASPAFYHHPGDILGLADFIVGRILDSLAVEHDLYDRWSGPAHS